MSSSTDEVSAAIQAAGGEIPFERYVELALYGDHGFYTRPDPGRAGRRGDFLTSPEVGPLFGAVLGTALDTWWDEVGRPSRFTVVDAGAGPGTLARSVAAAAPRCAEASEWIAVEVSAAQRGLHPEQVSSVDVMPRSVECGVVIANELLDNMPFELWVMDDGWRKAHVAERDGQFVEVLRQGTTPDVLPSRAPHGARAPVQRAASEWLAGTLASIGRGRVVVIDYCVATTAQMVARPWRDWLRTYVGHERGDHYLSRTGGQDLTVEVAIDQLRRVREPDAVRTQAQFLQLHGIDDLVAEGREQWQLHAAQPDLRALRMRSRVGEAEALLDPSGLGGFTVLEWMVG